MNGASSRSHSIFTIKIVRLAKDADPEDPAAIANVSRLSVVDLAGSERGKNADTKGDRLKEAGNINKSLMVLGQCMEVMRRNQEERAKGRKVIGLIWASLLDHSLNNLCRSHWFRSDTRSLQSYFKASSAEMAARCSLQLSIHTRLLMRRISPFSALPLSQAKSLLSKLCRKRLLRMLYLNPLRRGISKHYSLECSDSLQR